MSLLHGLMKRLQSLAPGQFVSVLIPGWQTHYIRFQAFLLEKRYSLLRSGQPGLVTVQAEEDSLCLVLLESLYLFPREAGSSKSHYWKASRGEEETVQESLYQEDRLPASYLVQA